MRHDPSSSKWDVIKTSTWLYYAWYLIALFCFMGAVWALVLGEYAWSLSLCGWGLAVSAHARIERLDGHRHMGGRNYVE